MSAYLVRVADTKCIVGVFWASDRIDLFHVIDEFVSPYACEIARLPSGGFYFQHDTLVPLEDNPHFKAAADDEDEAGDVLTTELARLHASTQMTERLTCGLSGWSALRWRPFTTNGIDPYA